MLSALGLVVFSGCGHGGPICRDLYHDVRRPPRGIVVFLVDGLPPRIVEQGCSAGWLPNIERRFRAGGLSVRHAVTCVPSITYAAIATLLTGVSPARHGIVGNHWFDPEAACFREYRMINSYRKVNRDLPVSLIYERIQPAASVSIQAAHCRGVTLDVANWAPSGIMWFFGDFTAVDKLTATSLWQVIYWANTMRQWPTLLTCYFPGLDAIGHRHGPGSEQFRWAAWHVDHQVGRICDWLERQGLLETTYLVLVSDHGMVDVDPAQRIDLMQLVRDRWHRNATDRDREHGPQILRRRYFDQFDTVVDHQDGRRAALHFRSPAGWHERPAPQVVAEILERPEWEDQLWNVAGIELVAYLKGDNEAVIRSDRGTAYLRARTGPAGPEYAYLPEPADVLGYLDDPNLAALVSQGYHDSRTWLAATAGQRLPDLVSELIPLLRVRRIGDAAAFAKPGYSFDREHGGHGGLDRDERLMTFMLAGPGIRPGGSIPAARAVDLVPTLLELLGTDPPAGGELEGVPLVSRAGLLCDGEVARP